MTTPKENYGRGNRDFVADEWRGRKRFIKLMTRTQHVRAASRGGAARAAKFRERRLVENVELNGGLT